MVELTDADQDLRGLLTRMIAQNGYAPSTDGLAAQAGIDAAEAISSLQRLHDANALLLHPHKCEPWVVHPFALAPGSCWVETPERGYWANCLYCAFGVAAALASDARITTRLGGESETYVYRIEGGRLLDTEGVFHLATPFGRWWDNVIHSCTSFQPFASEEQVGPWCERHAMPRGAVMSIEALWRFAGAWYGNYLSEPWRKRSLSEIRALLSSHGLTGSFWS